MKDKIIPKLTEGITLLQSLAVFYWIWDFSYLKNHFLLLFFIIGFIAPFWAFSVFHAFSKRELTKKSRLILSIWSIFIFLLFSIENIIRTFQNQQIENTGNLFESLYIGLQYFLLGVSSVYIVQNYCMLIAFLPSKGSFFNKKYYAEIKEAKAEHINRFSTEQIKISNALFCLIFASTFFYLNHFYKAVPKNIAIWLVFVTFPILLNFYKSLKQRN
ncbi:hypothetical protein [Flavobacterium sp. KACC 22761]|uniref:hypothetical protein n=1 Tax=Flavobacterium sp. KACC 22761 TaxID=3092665 RepID=UPI002A748343|nr:hypothetical protein [Flavobacterium sp. KACC 22761]WPO79959.1 hypothetical protein SCB73_06160 [Flavobacterium sp. KACC 22761]